MGQQRKDRKEKKACVGVIPNPPEHPLPIPVCTLLGLLPLPDLLAIRLSRIHQPEKLLRCICLWQRRKDKHLQVGISCDQQGVVRSMSEPTSG